MTTQKVEMSQSRLSMTTLDHYHNGHFVSPKTIIINRINRTREKFFVLKHSKMDKVKIGIHSLHDYSSMRITQEGIKVCANKVCAVRSCPKDFHCGATQNIVPSARLSATGLHTLPQVDSLALLTKRPPSTLISGQADMGNQKITSKFYTSPCTISMARPINLVLSLVQPTPTVLQVNCDFVCGFSSAN